MSYEHPRTRTEEISNTISEETLKHNIRRSFRPEGSFSGGRSAAGAGIDALVIMVIIGIGYGLWYLLKGLWFLIKSLFRGIGWSWRKLRTP